MTFGPRTDKVVVITGATMARLLDPCFAGRKGAAPGPGNLFAPSRDIGASGGVAVLLADVWLARSGKRMA